MNFPMRLRTPLSLTLLLALSMAAAVGLFVGPAAAQEQNKKQDQQKAEQQDELEGGPTVSVDDESARIVDYKGRIEDGAEKPISGVFGLGFKLYETKDAAEPIWSETRHVAVVDGNYTVPLGRSTSLTESQIEDANWIGVELAGQGEILRDRFEIKAGAGARAAKTQSQIERLIEKAKSDKEMAFADVARHAVRADSAEVAESAKNVGSLSAEEIKERSERALERLAEHKTNPEAHGASGGGKLGDRTRVMDSIGGPGGGSYRSTCPDGWVVAGIQGGAGRVVDSVSIVCKPLE